MPRCLPLPLRENEESSQRREATRPGCPDEARTVLLSAVSLTQPHQTSAFIIIFHPSYIFCLRSENENMLFHHQCFAFPMHLLILFLLMFYLGIGDSSSEHQVLVKLEEGLVRGEIEISDGGEQFYSFYGVPYALPPTGKRRFMRPEPVVQWDEVVGGQVVECAQEDTGRDQMFTTGEVQLRGVEDCLVANIYTPSLDTSSQLPIMIFVHGGGYFAGSASPGVYGPEYFMDYGVILITVNYRLGPFGFLSLGDDTIPGNQGLWDLKLAIEFIRNSAAHFGGDKNKITVVGHSAGAMAVQFLMMNPQMSGMFRGAILQSGPVISAYTCSDRHPAYYTRTLAGAIGCDPLANSSTIVKCLKSMDARDIVKYVRIVDQKPDVVKNAPNPWKPIMDGLFLPADEAFLHEDPYELLKVGKFHDIPIIIGHTKDEGLYAVTEAMSRFVTEY